MGAGRAALAACAALAAAAVAVAGEARAQDAICKDVLGDRVAIYEPDDPIPLEDGCGAPRVVTLKRAGALEARVRPPATVNCRMAAMVARWIDEVVSPAARTLLGAHVAAIGNSASYVCRNRNNQAAGKRSEHALANALDVPRFTLDDGRVISVLEHWGRAVEAGDERPAPATPERQFLEAVHAGACGLFGTVLGPEANEWHRDHFHLDLGTGGSCE